MSSLIGKPLQGGKYKLDEVLGRGGFGLTFRAHQVYLDQVVVIKTLNESHWDAANIGDLQRQFQEEARRLALCSHPNVVRVSDFFVEDGLPYMVMDYIPGRSLFDMVIPDNPLSEREAVDYTRQVGRALQAVHERGLLHRDVKPQNIMVHQLTGEAVLIDFGIARELTKNPAQTHTSIVSEGYAPIEQYLPRAHRSAATDIYGLAATLYTLLTAQVPVPAVLRDRTPLTPIRQIRPDVGEVVVEAIAHGMALELKDRPQAVGPWLSELMGKMRSPRSNMGAGIGAAPTQTAANPNSAMSRVPTQVVSPVYPSTGHRAKRGQSATGSKTVAVPAPVGYSAAPQAKSYAPVTSTKGQGCGCVSTLMILGIAIAGAFSGGAFWLYQQANSGVANGPAMTLPKVNLPDEVILPDVNLPEVNLPDINLPDMNLSQKEKKDKNGNPSIDATDEGSKEDANPDADPSASDYTPIPDSRSAASGDLPMALANSGDPGNDRPNKGKGGEAVTIPGFAPGDSEDSVRNRLGSPTRMTSANGYDTAIYSLVPNRVMLAYTYDQGSTAVRQSEGTFSPSTDLLRIRTALNGMLAGESTAEIVDGLEAVKKGKRDRYDFNSGSFSGTIERNNNDYVHIYVRD